MRLNGRRFAVPVAVAALASGGAIAWFALGDRDGRERFAAESLPACVEAFAAPTDQAKAADCRIAAERARGPGAPELAPLYARLADGLSAQTVDDDGAAPAGSALAGAALASPLRRRAYDAAVAASGRGAPDAAPFALAYARNALLLGRCDRPSDTPDGLLGEATEGFSALPFGHPRRRPGLAATAQAWADALSFAQAASTLSEAGPLSPGEQAQVGRWRVRAGDDDGAVGAFVTALRAPATPGDPAWDGRARLRAETTLRAILFRMGDVDQIRRLEAAGVLVPRG